MSFIFHFFFLVFLILLINILCIVVIPSSEFKKGQKGNIGIRGIDGNPQLYSKQNIFWNMDFTFISLFENITINFLDSQIFSIINYTNNTEISIYDKNWKVGRFCIFVNNGLNVSENQTITIVSKKDNNNQPIYTFLNSDKIVLEQGKTVVLFLYDKNKISYYFYVQQNFVEN
jgi:hypothetical protein